MVNYILYITMFFNWLAQRVPGRSGNMGCRVFNRGIQNQKGFWPKINILKGNYFILLIETVASCQKMTKFDFQKISDFFII